MPSWELPRAILRRGWAAPLLDLARLTPAYYRVAFLSAGLRSGILARIGDGGATPQQLASDLQLDTSMLEGLRVWLDLGVSVGVLRRAGGRYTLRRRARRLLKPSNDPIAALIEELAVLEHPLVFETPQRLAAGRPFEFADVDSALIARSSRLSTPMIVSLLGSVVPAGGRFRLLEVGCGSGEHIRSAAQRNPDLTALGLEVQEPAAQLARENLVMWGLADRVEVRTGDVRATTGTGDADLVTLHQNIYYFPDEDQVELLRHVGSFLAPGGRLLVTSLLRDSGLSTVGLDLWGAMTRGASRLPEPDELRQRVVAAGYTDVTLEHPGGARMFAAVTGTWPGSQAS